MKRLVILICIIGGCGSQSNILLDATVDIEQDFKTNGEKHIKQDFQIDTGYIYLSPDILSPDIMPEHYCGDFIANNNESCDGTDFKNKTCIDLGFFGGTLRCYSNCEIDYGMCNNCGDNKVDVTFGEECDGVGVECNIAMKDGYYTGWAICTNSCKLDKASCKKCTLPQGIYNMSGTIEWSTCSKIPAGKINEVWSWSVEGDLICGIDYEPVKFTATELMESPCSGSDDICEQTVYDILETKHDSFMVKRYVWYNCTQCSCELEVTLNGEYN